MTTSRNSAQLNSRRPNAYLPNARWLGTCVLLGALILLPVGIASAKGSKAGTDLEVAGYRMEIVETNENRVKTARVFSSKGEEPAEHSAS